MNKVKIGLNMLRAATIFKVGIFITMVIVILSSSEFVGMDRFFALVLIFIYFQLDDIRTNLRKR